MKHTAVIFVEKATTSTVTEFYDALSTHVISVKEKWSFELKTFRSTVKNLPQDDTKVMHSLTLTHHDNQTITLKNQSAIVTGYQVQDQLTSNGCSTGFPEPFDNILISKLSNIWTQRQSIKGEFGSTYETPEFLVRAANVFSASGFKGFLLELECDDNSSKGGLNSQLETIKGLLDEIKITDYKICSNNMKEGEMNFLCDLAYQYVKVLD
ncbi:HBR296Wp [Eremothecium sinecaudum]|uniref:Mediator of RNA polymerase II transcription subunit 20 n=1 Tax=Eremothecium sinecaudum TaxID=45286 RepID=A0A109UXM1_9SACH|nr:HBR296Wp [Eremothecium sinecaudum]AMD19197.1 HBR296Wp [Eremothecium sinecaudum]